MINCPKTINNKYNFSHKQQKRSNKTQPNSTWIAFKKPSADFGGKNDK